MTVGGTGENIGGGIVSWFKRSRDQVAGESRPPVPPGEPPLIDLARKETEKQEVNDLTGIGASPVNGVTLRRVLRGHSLPSIRIAWSPDGRFLASSSKDSTVRIWDMTLGQCVRTLEHEARIDGVAWSPDGQWLASGTYPSGDRIGVLRIWAIATGRTIVERDHGGQIYSLAWSAQGESLASGTREGELRLWNTRTWQSRQLLEGGGEPFFDMAWSPDGQTLATASTEKMIRLLQVGVIEGTWKLKGHSDAVNNVTFSPDGSLLASASQDNTIRIWETGSRKELVTLEGHTAMVTSVSGAGLDHLLETLKDQIPWDQMKATVTTVTFKRIKEYVLALKALPDRAGVLVQWPELRQHLQASDAEWRFTDIEMTAAVRHLENHGYVSILRTSSGTESILLVPELLADLASSIVLHADKHPRELGALSETDLLQGRYPFAELNGLGQDEQQSLVDAAVVRFVDHNICFRESLGPDTLLIFPGLIKQKRPLLEETETIEDMSYIVRGRVENVYAALAVLLGYTQTFTRVNQWQNQAQYELGKGEICGFRLIEEIEGEIELVLYYSRSMPQYGRATFQGLFEQFLYQRDVEVAPFPPVICPNTHRQERATVIRRARAQEIHLLRRMRRKGRPPRNGGPRRAQRDQRRVDPARGGTGPPAQHVRDVPGTGQGVPARPRRPPLLHQPRPAAGEMGDGAGARPARGGRNGARRPRARLRRRYRDRGDDTSLRPGVGT
jgi:WD domain, G-beta repeat